MKQWTAAEKEYLEENYGKTSIPTLAKRLNRSENAIMIMRGKLGLGSFLDNGEHVTFRQLLLALGFEEYSYYFISWIKNRNFPVHRKKVINNSFLVVYLEEFWEWADKNRTFLDFSKFEENALGLEPEWVKSKRKADVKRSLSYIKTPWTPVEDSRLRKYLREYKYTYPELSKKLNRTEGAIQRRIVDLKLKERPLKADNHISWTKEEFCLLGQMINAGNTYEEMSEAIGKSTKAIRGKVYNNYLTENLCRVRQMLNGAKFGENKPEIPLSKLRLMHIEEKTQAKTMLSLFCNDILLYRESVMENRGESSHGK